MRQKAALVTRASSLRKRARDFVDTKGSFGDSGEVRAKEGVFIEAEDPKSYIERGRVHGDLFERQFV